MSQWIFFGRVTPERVPLHISHPIRWASESIGLGIKMDLVFCVAHGHFICNVRIAPGDTDPDTIKNLVEIQIRSVVDLVGYLHAIRYDVEIIAAHHLDSGSQVVFGINIPILSDRRATAGPSAYPSVGALPLELLNTLGSEPASQVVLQEFREAMGFAVGTGFHCYRAIEAMMQSFKTDGVENESFAWSQLRQQLNLDRKAIEYVKAHADAARHGKVSSISDADRAKLFEITDEIVRRYLHYLSRGKQHLPVIEFPVLMHSNR